LLCRDIPLPFSNKSKLEEGVFLMGRNPRMRQERLAEKLLQIRFALGLSQTDMLKRLRAENLFAYTYISRFERGEREPPLRIILEYARLAGICTDVLIDDDLDLPAKLPAKAKHR
jgi:transcriptional regulator with XRE-family HTH domain